MINSTSPILNISHLTHPSLTSTISFTTDALSISFTLTDSYHSSLYTFLTFLYNRPIILFISRRLFRHWWLPKHFISLTYLTFRFEIIWFILHYGICVRTWHLFINLLTFLKYIWSVTYVHGYLFNTYILLSTLWVLIIVLLKV